MSRALTMYDVFELLDGRIETPVRIPGHMMCPFHAEDTASLAVWDDHVHCFGCGVGGGPFWFLAKAVGRQRAEILIDTGDLDGDIDLSQRPDMAPRKLPDLGEVFEQATVNTTPSQMLEAEAFVKEKWPHIGLCQLMAWGVGVGAYTLLIPHTDNEGVIRGIKTRTFAGGNKGRKLAYPGSVFTTRLYRVEDRPGAEGVMLVEGESDTWTVTRAHPTLQVFGLPSGAQTWKPEFKAEIRSFGRRPVFVSLDNDDTGRAASDRIVKDLGDSTIRYNPPEPHKDWTDAYLAGWRP